jgi:predicted DNA-binding transcriptional regulator YafY
MPPDKVPDRGDKVDKTERLLNLVSCLLAARTPVPFHEIRGSVVGYDDGADDEALEKRFDRDKAELRALGVPIDYVTMDALGNSGYGIRKDRYFLPEIRLTVDEALVLAVLHRGAAEGGAAFGPSLLSALQKVSADTPLGEGLRSSLAEQHAFGVRPGRGARKGHDALEALTAAVLQRRPVRFRYYGIGRDREQERRVEPWGLGHRGGRWYLVGLDRDRGEERTFRVDRVRGRVEAEAAGASPAYTVPADFDLEDRLSRQPWEYEPGTPFRARIRFAPAVAWMAKENLRRGESFRELPGGAGILEFPATSVDAVVRFALKHGRLARVEGPPAAREAWTARLRACAAAHRAEAPQGGRRRGGAS